MDQSDKTQVGTLDALQSVIPLFKFFFAFFPFPKELMLAVSLLDPREPNKNNCFAYETGQQAQAIVGSFVAAVPPSNKTKAEML